MIYEATSLFLGEKTYQEWRGFPVITTPDIKVPLQIEMDEDIAKFANERNMHYYNQPRLFPKETPKRVTANIISTNLVSITGYVPKYKKQAQPPAGADRKSPAQP